MTVLGEPRTATAGKDDPGSIDGPDRFRLAVAGLRSADMRRELTVREISAPTRLAPHAFALAAELVRGGEELASGRFILLHDPDGHQAWEGTSRVVVFVRAEVDEEMAGDPLLADVGWSWLQDALDARGAGRHAAGGTVTTTVSRRFGALADEPDVRDVEMRASWTPAEDDLTAHLAAFADLVCAMAGQPLADGVRALVPRRRS